MSTTWRFAVRAVLAGLLAALTSLQAALPGLSLDDLLTAVIGGGIAALAFAGVAAVTPIDRSVGKG